jgi:hypothetical protein
MNNRHSLRPIATAWIAAGLFAFWVGTATAAAPAPDHSPVLQKYLEAGVPPIDKPWTPEDFQRAAKVLEELGAKDVTQLPRYNSENSGVLFAHIIAQENLSSFTDNNVPVDTRMKLVNDAPAYLPVFVLYVHAATAEQTFDTEMLELGGFILRVEMAEAAVFDEFVAAHPEKKDETRTTRGLKQMRDSIAQTASGLIELMMDRTCVRTSEATRFAQELKYVLPKCAAALLPEAQDHLKSQLKQAAANEQDTGLKTALTELLAAMR